ncbi:MULTISPECIES: DUF4124 domain-containing protein [unclassified Undibacterium]|uniref:DUF4124 domain-containing protein n=1 Tax=unclassified Undibacterium TaxID=2630295 RepID=UPI002AC99CB5|nr:MULTISPECIES: DUF4124 domain-containing protein [unclassified Undibacterium]MEB0138502.1 DUF4124 domain-containing protein [Undibacterium sp. CCC2.1]MEB0173097.1 DUF4124 domain-containing protein [Undibacterium sp. CCC1.1]MEB0176149.1 DUF4124 domain-containing protein [Undibacterium sp. CCC3.4]MEB0215415.1 DUF4124 domain-containing protein [Undibacterium sp. 5I2]WPX42756.1 DUF4124 domain-containing protein [Undibacterium sp. CCC3.4]
MSRKRLLNQKITADKGSLLLGAVLSLTLMSAQAQVFRCQNAAGEVVFSDQTCPGDSQGRRFKVQANGGRAGREIAAPLQVEPLPPAAAASESPQNEPHPLQVDAMACEHAQRNYDVSAASSNPNLFKLKALASAMYAACGLREPDISTTTIHIDNNAIQGQAVPASK